MTIASYIHGAIVFYMKELDLSDNDLPSREKIFSYQRKLMQDFALLNNIQGRWYFRLFVDVMFIDKFGILHWFNTIIKTKKD